MKISIVSPIYKAEKIVEELVKRCETEVSKISNDYEIILVEDGSPDQSWEVITRLCQKNERIKGIKLSRNFGQHYAISAGMKECSGEIAILLDCDLQDNPSYFSLLVTKYKEGADIVFTEKDKRKHSFFKNLTANFFNMMFNYLVDEKNWKASKNIGSYSLISRKVIDSYNNINDYRRHYLMILRWLGFNSTTIKVEHDKRFEGKSSYTLSKLVEHAIDGLTSQSDRILRLTVVLGFILSSFSFLSAMYIIIRSLIDPFLNGWASLAVLILFVGGLIITSIGITGIYIGKIFEQTKQRPLYLIDKKVNL